MNVGLDTSVVVRLLTLDPPELASSALNYLRERQAAGDTVCVSDWVLAETYYALQHHYSVPKKEAIEALRKLTTSSGVKVSETAATVLALPSLESARPGFIDRLIHRQYMQEGASEVATFERSAHKLPHVRVLDAGK